MSGSLRRAALPGAVVLTLTLALAACAPSSDPASSTPRVARLSIATGGTGGVYYLRKMLNIVLFPEIWKLRTDL